MEKMEKMVTISLKDSKEFGEAWLQKVIAENPAILGLPGEVRCRDKERIQQYGRLDLLLEDSSGDTPIRYEVETQLGPMDPSHIIRAIEYWDNESRYYPQYDHVAVLIAEDTTRYLNVIQLFNRTIPIIVMKVEAFKIGDAVQLNFVKILDRVKFDIEEEGDVELTDRGYWEKTSTPTMMKLMDRLFDLIKSVDDIATPNYNKFYVGLLRDNVAKNYCFFRPKKSFVDMCFKIDEDTAKIDELDAAGIDAGYKPTWNELRIKFSEFPNDSQVEIIKKLIEAAKKDRV